MKRKPETIADFGDRICGADQPCWVVAIPDVRPGLEALIVVGSLHGCNRAMAASLAQAIGTTMKAQHVILGVQPCEHDSTQIELKPGLFAIIKRPGAPDLQTLPAFAKWFRASDTEIH